MTDFMTRVDEIANDAVLKILLSEEAVGAIKTALWQAVDEVLMMEPSEEMRKRGNEALGLEKPIRCSHVYRAMRAAQLAEIKDGKK